MVIGLDGHTLSDVQKHGVAIYAKSLLQEMVGQSEDDFILYTKNKLAGETWKKPNVQIRELSARFGWTQWRLSWELLVGKRPDVLLCLAHSLPRFDPVKTAVAVHDLAFWRFPEYFLAKDLRRLKWLTKDAVSRAQGIIAISESTKRDLLKFYPEVTDLGKKIHITPLAYEKELFFARKPEEIEAVGKKYGLEKDYLLYVGALQPRKNLPVLIEAFEKLCAQGKDLELVLSGGKGWLSEMTLERIKTSKCRDKIKILGYVDRGDLPAIYSGASIFVLPSLYEGFGLPILEAMACGTPVIYADNSSLPEVAGKAGMSFETNDADDLARKITEIINNDKTRIDLIHKGLARAKEFSWEKTAKMTLEILKGL